MLEGEDAAQAGVLHADLDGEGAFFQQVEAKDAAGGVAQEEAREVEQHGSGEDPGVEFREIGAVEGDDQGAYKDDEGGGDGREDP